MKSRISAQRIGDYERWRHGGRRPSIYVLTVLAAALGTSIDHLLDADDYRALPSSDQALLVALRRAAADRVADPTGLRPAGAGLP